LATQVFEFGIGWFEMRNTDTWRRGNTEERIVPASNDFRQVASKLCEQALEDARNQLHPLLQNTELDRLDHRNEFLGAFKSALERRIARQLAIWHPGVQAVFQYDETRMAHLENWNGTLHLLVKVPRLSSAVKTFGKKLDKSLVNCLRQLNWRRFRKCQSVLDVQQVTPNELRRGLSYGAMFCAVYNTPIKLWPPAA
jgi:hypothetical protein